MEPGAEQVAMTLANRRIRPYLAPLDSPHFDQEALAQDLNPANIQALGRAIDRAKDPKQRQILMQELERIKGLAANLMGPVNPPPMLPGNIPEGGPMRAPYNPQEQRPGVYGGQRMTMPPNPGSM